MKADLVGQFPMSCSLLLLKDGGDDDDDDGDDDDFIPLCITRLFPS